jgi:hypothetical protein
LIATIDPLRAWSSWTYKREYPYSPGQQEQTLARFAGTFIGIPPPQLVANESSCCGFCVNSFVLWQNPYTFIDVGVCHAIVAVPLVGHIGTSH